MSDMARPSDTSKTPIYAKVDKADLAELDAHCRETLLTRSTAVAQIVRAWADGRRAKKPKPKK